MTTTLPSVFTQDVAKCSPLNEGQLKVLTMLAMSAMTGDAMNFEVPVKARDLSKVLTPSSAGVPVPTPVKIIADRLATATPDVEYTQAVITFLGALSETPGDCVMFAYSLYRETIKRGHAIGTRQLAMDIIPMGAPNRDVLSAFWDSQKDGSRNRLDFKEAWA